MVAFFDIETDIISGFKDVNPITTIIIGLFIEKSNIYQINVYSTKDIDHLNGFKDDMIFGFTFEVQTIKFTSQSDLLRETNKYLKVLNPELIGYNISGFHLKSLQAKSQKLDLDLDWEKFGVIDLYTEVKKLNKLNSYRLPDVYESLLKINLKDSIFSKIDRSILPILYTIDLCRYLYGSKYTNELNENYGYHLSKIEKGILGEFSKIKEEFLEAEDAITQNNTLMSLVELSDLLGAIEAYAKTYNMSLNDLLTMKDATKRAFESGRRA